MLAYRSIILYYYKKNPRKTKSALIQVFREAINILDKGESYSEIMNEVNIGSILSQLAKHLPEILPKSLLVPMGKKSTKHFVGFWGNLSESMPDIVPVRLWENFLFCSTSELSLSALKAMARPSCSKTIHKEAFASLVRELYIIAGRDVYKGDPTLEHQWEDHIDAIIVAQYKKDPEIVLKAIKKIALEKRWLSRLGAAYTLSVLIDRSQE